MIQLAEELAEASFDVEYLYDSLLLEEKQSLAGTKLLWLPQAKCMTEEFATKFYDWVKRGGVAIAGGAIPGLLNENGHPSPACPLASNDTKEDWNQEYGQGRILFFPKLPKDFLKIQSPFVSKAFGSDNTNLQFRMCEKDGKSYLFVVNWDENPCESEIFVRGKYAAVIDLGLQLPLAVPTRFADGATSFKTRFAPGDMTLFQLQGNGPL